METIYIDAEYHCHRTNDGTMTAVETDFFKGMCDAYVEGYAYDMSTGSAQIYPWKPHSELESAQREHERRLLAEYEAAFAEIEKALGV